MACLGVYLIYLGLPSDTGEPVTCHGVVMAPDDTCVVGTEVGAPQGVGSRYDYAETKQQQDRKAEGSWKVMAGGAGVLVFTSGIAFGPALFERWRKKR